MVKITVVRKEEVEVKTLKASCGVRYWEDAYINDIEDTKGDMPCRNGDSWEPVIDLESGQIINWIIGIKASIHYKVCDMGKYLLLDDNGETVREIDGYVPSIMSPKENGYGDYVIMDIDENGFIQNWKINLGAFEGTDND